MDPPGRIPLFFQSLGFLSAQKHKLSRGRFLSSFIKLHSAVPAELSKSEAGAAILFSDLPEKNKKLIEDVEFLPFKFWQIPLSGFREEVENVSANQRPGWPSWFSDRPEKHKLGTGRRVLASCKFWQIPFSGFRDVEKRRKCLSRSNIGTAILISRSAPKNTNLVEEFEILFPVKFRQILLSVSEKSKMWKVNDGRATDNNSAFELSV